ncbi:uncharacterized protein [Drosophila tropicalis]|uniref:uncharacterized protein n=1 Tax=Drosophila tropicalis TaxID=46794 RepID=UPI0035ABBD1A
MIKYVWHVAALMIVFCWLSSARSASYQQQQLNGLVMDQKPQQQQNRIQQASSGTSPVSFWKDMSLVYRICQQCTGENMSVCLKVKLLTGLEKAFRSAKSLTLFEGVQFVSSSPDNQQGSKLPSISEQDIEAVLPRGVDAKEQVLNIYLFIYLFIYVN